MNTLLAFVVLAVFSASAFVKESPPKVHAYTRDPVEFGKENELICHVNGFYPEDINIDLLKNDEKIPDAKQTDLTFDKDLLFSVTSSVDFTPIRGEMFTCRVKHQSTTMDYTLEADM